MQSHLKLLKSYKPISNTRSGYLNNNKLVTALNNILVSTDISTCQIINRVAYESAITSFFVNEDLILVGLFNGTLFYNEEEINLHKSAITTIVYTNNNIITGSADKTIKIYNTINKNITHKAFLKNTVSCLEVTDQYIFAGDIEGNIYQYNIDANKTYRFKSNTQAICKLIFIEDSLFAFGHDGRISKFFINECDNEFKKLEMFMDAKGGEKSIGFIYYNDYTVDYNITDCILVKNQFYITGDNGVINIMSQDLISCGNMRIFESSKIVYKSIFFGDRFLLMTDEDELVFLDVNNNVEFIIAGNNDEITDMLLNDGYLYITTNSGRLRCLREELSEGDYCSKIQLYEGHDEAIMCVRACNDYLITASRDHSVILWRFINNVKSENKLIEKLQISQHSDSVNSCDINNEIFVTVSKDLTLQIYKYGMISVNKDSTSEKHLNDDTEKQCNNNTQKLTYNNTEKQTFNDNRKHCNNINRTHLNNDTENFINNHNKQFGNDNKTYLNNDTENFKIDYTKKLPHNDNKTYLNNDTQNFKIDLTNEQSNTTIIKPNKKMYAEQICTKLVHQKEINCVRINNKNKLIGTASQDKTVKLFDYEGNEIATLSGHKRGVWMIDFGTEILISCSTDETIRVWGLRDFTCSKVLEGHGCSILNVKLFNNDKQIISSGNDGIIKLWDIRKGKILNTIDQHKEKVWCILISDYFYTASTDGIINIFKDETEKITNLAKEKESKEKENIFLIDKNIRNKNFIDAFKIAYEQEKINENLYFLISKLINDNDKKNILFEILATNLDKFYLCLEKWIKLFKNADITQKLLSEAIKRKMLTKNNELIINLQKKHLKASDELFRNLYSYELLFKSFINKL
ncbi:U3 small nucleolar RNA-associated protein 13 [Conglomerata obtusa]